MDVCHVALIPGTHDIVLPGTQPGLCQGILALAMQAHKHIQAVHLVTVNTGNFLPGHRAALCRGQVLHGVEAVIDKIRVLGNRLAMQCGAKAVGSVGHDSDPPQRLLNGIFGGFKKGSLPLRNFQKSFVIAGDTEQIHGNDGLGSFRNQALNGIVIHGKAALFAVHQHNFRPHMLHHGSACGVGIGRDDHFVSRSDAQDPQGQLGAGGLGIQAGGSVRSAALCHLLFQLLGARARGDPAGAQRGHNLIDLIIRNVRGTEGNFSHFAPPSAIDRRKSRRCRMYTVLFILSQFSHCYNSVFPANTQSHPAPGRKKTDALASVFS